MNKYKLQVKMSAPVSLESSMRNTVVSADMSAAITSAATAKAIVSAGETMEAVLTTGNNQGTGDTDGGINYEIGTGLKVEDNVLSVDSAKDFEGDNTRPVEAAFMQEQIGNIEILLKTI